MSAERKPQAEFSLLDQPLRIVTVLVARFPNSVIVISALLVAVSLTGAQLSLGFRTSRTDLLNPKSEHNRRWSEFVQEFGDQEDVTIVVHSENRQAVPPILDELAALVGSQPKRFRSIHHKIDMEKLRSKGLYHERVGLQTLQRIDRFLGDSQGIVNGNLSGLNVGGQIVWMADQIDRGDPAQFMAALGAPDQTGRPLEILHAALSRSGEYQSPFPELAEAVAQTESQGAGYTLLKDGRVGLLTLHLVKNEKAGSFAEYSDGLAELRQIVANTRSRHPNAWIGLTGIPVLENDEMESSQKAMAAAGLLSFLGVGLLYVAGFGCVRHPVMALAALMVPMGWSFGYILLTVGHLNILSSAFATIVIGLGSDFGVYHIAQYLRYRGEKMSSLDALVATARSIGPGLTTSAVATAAAFYTIGMSDFPGIAELGIIAGGGILLCWLAALTTLPALIQWSDAERPHWQPPEPLDVFAWFRPLLRWPKLVLAGYVAFTVFTCLGLKDLWYDHNLLNLQAEGLESVELEKSLLKSDCGASYTVVVARSREEVVQRKAMYANRQLCPLVDSVKEIATYVPADAARKQPLIQRIHERLARLPQHVPAFDIPIEPPDRLDRALGKLESVMTAMRRVPEAVQVRQIRDLTRNLTQEEYFRRLKTFQNALAADVLRSLYALKGVSNPEPPDLSDLPAALVARFVGRSGFHCMQIHTKADIWNMGEMEQFVGQLRNVDALLRQTNPTIDSAVTGNPVQIYESSREMMWGYERGACYGILIVIIVVWLDFRNVRMTLLALLPLITSKLQLFGLMGLLGIPLNPANMIVLPLILGIGVDTGIQVVHDYLREPHPYRMNPATSAALVINTLMNIVGFGALMIASHRGLHSLGRVLTLGMACCLLSCMVMPSLLQVLPDLRPRQPEDLPSEGQIQDSGIELAGRISPVRSHAPVIRRRAA